MGLVAIAGCVSPCVQPAAPCKTAALLRQLIFPIGRGIIIFRVGQRRPRLKERHRA
jgi:hypothetical protein